MIARPNIGRNAWHTAERTAFDVGRVARFSRPGARLPHLAAEREAQGAVEVARRRVVEVQRVGPVRVAVLLDPLLLVRLELEAALAADALGVARGEAAAALPLGRHEARRLRALAAEDEAAVAAVVPPLERVELRPAVGARAARHGRVGHPGRRARAQAAAAAEALAGVRRADARDARRHVPRAPVVPGRRRAVGARRRPAAGGRRPVAAARRRREVVEAAALELGHVCSGQTMDSSTGRGDTSRSMPETVPKANDDAVLCGIFVATSPTS